MDQSLYGELDRTIRAIPDFPKPGILFRDIAPIFLNPSLCEKTVDEMAKQLANVEFDAIAGLEARGFLLGVPLATKLNKPFIMVRKAGKLPGKTIQKEYDLEYGTAKIEIQEEAIKPGTKVLIHDDLLATGGTALACSHLIEKAGGKIAGCMFIIELDGLEGRQKLETNVKNVVSLLKY